MTDQPMEVKSAKPADDGAGSDEGLGLLARLGGVTVFLAWTVLFAVGLMVASLPYRMQISALASASDVAATIEGVFVDARSIEDAAEQLVPPETAPLDSAALSGQAGQFQTQPAEQSSDVRQQRIERDLATTALDSTLRETAATIRSSVEPAELPWAITWIVALLSYTPTNILLLAAFAGILGSLACRANLDWQSKPEDLDEGEAASATAGSASRCDTINPCFSGLVRGLFVYLMLISGLLLLTEDPFTNLNASRYVRLAGFTSLISFLVSLRGGLFARFLSGAAKRVGD